MASVKARGKAVVPEHGSFSDPHLGREKLGFSPRKQRTIKYMGKAAHKHSSGSSVTIAPWAAQVIKGDKVTASPKAFDDSTIRGDMTQAKGVPYRRKPPQPKKSPATIQGEKQAALAAKHGMTVAQFKAKMAADAKKHTAALKKQNGLKVNPYKKKHGPGKGH